MSVRADFPVTGPRPNSHADAAEWRNAQSTTAGPLMRAEQLLRPLTRKRTVAPRTPDAWRARTGTRPADRDTFRLSDQGARLSA